EVQAGCPRSQDRANSPTPEPFIDTRPSVAAALSQVQPSPSRRAAPILPAQRGSSMNKLGIVLAIGMGAVLVLAVVYAVQLFMRIGGGAAMGVHGWTALILGVVFATALG